jgi:hypothetical protein
MAVLVITVAVLLMDFLYVFFLYRLVRLLAWIILAGDNEVFTERGATLYVSSPRRKPRIKPSFVAPPESLDKLLADR